MFLLVSLVGADAVAVVGEPWTAARPWLNPCWLALPPQPLKLVV